MTLLAGTTIVGLTALLLYIVEFAFLAKQAETTPMQRVGGRGR